jgi:hypothetical protein
MIAIEFPIAPLLLSYYHKIKDTDAFCAMMTFLVIGDPQGLCCSLPNHGFSAAVWKR